MPRQDSPKTPQQQSGVGRPTTLTWEVFQAICARVEETGVKYASCAAFGFQGSWVTTRIKELETLGQPEWRELWEESLEMFADRLEAEMARRAIDGSDKPVFYKGEIVGHITEFSDTLAITLAKAVRPERFRDNVKLEADITGGVLLVPPKMTVEEFLAQASKPSEDASDQGGES